jgi:glycosyltransferase involved in cell wall biosynthesis
MKGQHHIAQLHTSSAWGGGEYQVLNMVKGLAGRRVRTTLFTHPYGRLMAKAGDSGQPVRAVPRMSFLPFVPFSLSSLCGTLRELGVDLIHAHDALAATIAAGIHRKTGIPAVLSRRVASPVRSNAFSRRKYSADNFTAVIAISETVKKAFAESSGYPADRIFIAPTGVDITAVDRIEADGEFREHSGGAYMVAGIGKLSQKKNWQFMIRVAAHIARTGLNVHWCLAGEGPEQKRLRALSAELGIADRFHFLGFRQDATNLLKSSDLLFFPSLMEGASVTVRTAMVCGTPVVAVDAPGTMESLAGNGWAVKPGDIEGAAASVLDALTNQAKREAFRKDGRESAVSRFSFQRTVDDTIRVYEDVLEGGAKDR